MFYEDTQGRVWNENGKIIYFSLESFLQDICQKNGCFICGAKPDESPFDNQHILPDWILNKFNLSSKLINLPDGSRIQYGKYTISCCEKCKIQMTREIEEPIKQLIESGYEGVAEYIKKYGSRLVFVWLCLVFIKTHLKGEGHGLDKRIATKHERQIFHHLHCIARSFYTEAQLDASSYGTLLVLPASKDSDLTKNFDYIDMPIAKTLLLRIDDVCFLAVLDDSCAALSRFMNMFSKISGFLSPIQLREILGHLTYLNLSLRNRPKHVSQLNTFDNYYRIFSEHPEFSQLKPFNPKNLGNIIYECLEPILSLYVKPEKLEETKNQIKKGQYTFLGEQKSSTLL